jgi:hypothetical protein
MTLFPKEIIIEAFTISEKSDTFNNESLSNAMKPYTESIHKNITIEKMSSFVILIGIYCAIVDILLQLLYYFRNNFKYYKESDIDVQKRIDKYTLLSKVFRTILNNFTIATNIVYHTRKEAIDYIKIFNDVVSQIKTTQLQKINLSTLGQDNIYFFNIMKLYNGAIYDKEVYKDFPIALKEMRESGTGTIEYDKLMERLESKLYEVNRTIYKYYELKNDNNQILNTINVCNKIEQDDLKFPIIDKSELRMSCQLLSSSHSILRGTVFPYLLQNTISDIIFYSIGSVLYKPKIPDPSKSIMPIFIYIHYITALGAAFHHILNNEWIIRMSQSGNQIGNNPYSSGLNTLLPNLLNTMNLYRIRLKHLPIFQSKKEGAYRPIPFFYSVHDVIINSHLNLKEISERANPPDDPYTDTKISRLHNIIKYISEALMDNAINAEYAVLIILSLYNIQYIDTLGIANPNTLTKPNSLFQEVIRCILNIEGFRNTSFYSLFDTPIETWTLGIYKEMLSENEIKETKDYDKLQLFNQYLEIIFFVTILQHIITNDEFNKEIYLKYKNVSPDYLFYNTHTAMGSMFNEVIFTKGDIRDIIIDDIRNAVTSLDSTVHEKLNEGDWFAIHKDKIWALDPSKNVVHPSRNHIV